jgi:hypothetical protein
MPHPTYSREPISSQENSKYNYFITHKGIETSVYCTLVELSSFSYLFLQSTHKVSKFYKYLIRTSILIYFNKSQFFKTVHQRQSLLECHLINITWCDPTIVRTVNTYHSWPIRWWSPIHGNYNNLSEPVWIKCFSHRTWSGT